ncbi:MAG: Xaa-Pro peptidase family protein [Candidatus Bathyarchaeia archaeon]|jgi:Xaa-Pro aminopeptidase
MTVFEERIEALKKEGKKVGIDAFLVTSERNMRYLAGFSTLAIERFAGIVIPVEVGVPIVIVPRLEETKAKRFPLKEIMSYSDSESPALLLNKVVKELKLEKATFGIEGTLPFKFYRMLVTTSSRIRTEDTSDLFSQLRCIKSEQELGMIEKAADIVAEGIKAGIEFTKPGVTELAISSQIERTIKENGGESVPFCLVLSGANSALPHGETSNRKVSEKDVVLMDVGAVYEGYYGDLTRTIFVGEATKKEKEIYDVVAQAQETAIKCVRPSVKAEEVDAAARKVIENAGYGKYFTHRTGHGIGLEVHEEPYIVQGNKTRLKPGMAFTIEPGIYFFEKFGVRIEDNMAVSQTKGRMLSRVSKELVVV